MVLKNKIFTALVLSGTWFSSSVVAIDNNGPLDSALAAGIIGEQSDGYLGFVLPPSAAQMDLQRRVNEINIRRRKMFQDAARLTGDPVNRIALLSGLRQITKKPDGQYFQDTTKTWCSKGPESQMIQSSNDEVIIRCGPTDKLR